MSMLTTFDATPNRLRSVLFECQHTHLHNQRLGLEVALVPRRGVVIGATQPSESEDRQDRDDHDSANRWG